MQGRAVVSMPMTLEPWPSSVMPKQPGRSSVSRRGRNAAWCFAVPSLAMVPPHSVKCTPALMHRL